MPFDKIHKEGYSREQKIEALRRSVMLQKKCMHNCGKGGYVYITDGTNIKKTDPDLPIPEGWWRGCPRKKERGVKHE